MVKLSKAAKTIIDRLTEGGFSAYAVGGAVRDSLLKRESHDFDVTTSATPGEVKALFEHTYDTGIAHGTVTVLEDGDAVEVTTFRSDGEYLFHRKPESVTLVTDVKEDLARRDFTINALCYNEQEGLLDLFGGLDDLNNSIIRAIGSAEKRFEEDALRMLRAVRFCAQLGFTIEKNTEDAIKKCAHLVKSLSAERISSELDKILMSTSPQHIEMLFDLGLLQYIAPQMCDCFMAQQNIRWHIYDVGRHTLKVIENCPPVLHLRYAALMHDWGKPHTRGKNEQGEDTFRNHAAVSEKLAENFCIKYKFSNERKDKILRLVKYHDIEILPEKKYVKRAVNKVGDDIFYDLLCLKRADCLGQNLELTAERLPYIDSLFALYKEIKENKEPFGIKNLAVDGNDLIALGITGRDIGTTLNHLLEMVIDNPALNEKEKLIKIIKDLI